MSTSNSNVGKFTLKPQPPVEAVQWTGDNFEQIKAWRNQLNGCEVAAYNELRVRPKIGQYFYVRVGDWVICERGEYQACTNAEFHRLYQPLLEEV